MQLTGQQAEAAAQRVHIISMQLFVLVSYLNLGIMMGYLWYFSSDYFMNLAKSKENSLTQHLNLEMGTHKAIQVRYLVKEPLVAKVGCLWAMFQEMGHY